MERTLAQPPTLGRGRLVCVDGPAGSGKTTLAAELRHGFRGALRRPGATAARGRVRLLHMDDVYDGWTGLHAGMTTVSEQVVGPLRDGRPGRYRRYDWHQQAFAEERVVDLCDVLLVEGVGSGGFAHGGYAASVTCLVWVDTPPAVRLARGLARDGEQMREHWLTFAAEEDAMFVREGIRERAHMVVDGTGGPSR